MAARRSCMHRIPAGLALACALAAPAAAAEAVPASKALEPDLLGIRAHTQNMRMKVENSVIGLVTEVDPGEGAPEVTGWVRQCCVNNVVVMNRRLRGFERIARELDRRYREAARPEGMRLSGEILADVEALHQRLAAFASAPDRPSAQGIIRNMIRVVAMLNHHHRELAECCDDVRVVVEPPQTRN